MYAKPSKRSLGRVKRTVARVLLCAFSLMTAPPVCGQGSDTAESVRPSISLTRAAPRGGVESRAGSVYGGAWEVESPENEVVDDAGGVFIAASYPESHWLWPVVGSLLLLSLVAVCKRGESFVFSVEMLLNKTFTGGEELCDASLRACSGWLKKAGEKNGDEQAGADALFTLLGLICLSIAGLAAYADYFILNQSLIILWPINETTWVMAANVAGLKALVGICLHLFRGKRAQKMLLCGLLGLLLVSEFTVSYLRVREIAVNANADHTATIHSDDPGSLIINDPTADEGSPPAAAGPPASPGGAGRADGFHFYAILSGLLAVLFALSETIGLYAAIRYAGAGMIWLAASPALVVLSLALCTFRFLGKGGIVGMVKVVLTVLIGTLSGLSSLAVSGVKAALRYAGEAAGWLRGLPFRLGQGYRAWRIMRLYHREEMNRLRACLRLATASELHLLRVELKAREKEADGYRTHTGSEAEAYWRQHASMAGKLRRSAEEVLDDLLDRLKSSWRLINEQLSADLVQTATGKARKKAEPAAEQVSSAAAEVFEKVSGLLSSVNGGRRLPHCDRGKAAAKELED